MPQIISSNQEKLKESIAELIETERTYVSRLMTTYKVSKFLNIILNELF